jgi:Zn-dependent protease
LAPTPAAATIADEVSIVLRRAFTVNLTEPERTQYDLQWQMFGIHVRVHPLFWIISAFLGWSTLQRGFPYLLAWIGCVFVSILIHELGHVVVGNYFGSRGHIVLYSFGGLAIGSSNLMNRWHRVAVSFAGPFAQFLLLIPIYFLALSISPSGRYRSYSPGVMEKSLEYLWWINLAWPILNLLPIWPLDGGKISRELFDWSSPRQGIRSSLILSAVIAGLLAFMEILALIGRIDLPLDMAPSPYMALFFGLFAYSSIQLLQQHQPPRW